MSVELNDEGIFSILGQLIVNRQNAEMIAGDPKQSLGFAPHLADRLPRFTAPIVIRSQLVEGKLLEPDLILISASASCNLFAPIVLQHLAQRVGEKLCARRGAAPAKKIERKDDDLGFQFHPPPS